MNHVLVIRLAGGIHSGCPNYILGSVIDTSLAHFSARRIRPACAGMTNLKFSGLVQNFLNCSCLPYFFSLEKFYSYGKINHYSIISLGKLPTNIVYCPDLWNWSCIFKLIRFDCPGF